MITLRMVFLSTALLAAGCSSKTLLVGENPDAITPFDGAVRADAGGDSGDSGGDSSVEIGGLLDGTETAAEVSYRDGFQPRIAPNECIVGEGDWTIDFATQHLHLKGCIAANSTNAGSHWVERDLELTANQFAEIRNLIKAINVAVRPEACISDAPTSNLSLTRPAGTTRYADPFTACPYPEVTPVDKDALAALIALLRTYFPTEGSQTGLLDGTETAATVSYTDGFSFRPSGDQCATGEGEWTVDFSTHHLTGHYCPDVSADAGRPPRLWVNLDVNLTSTQFSSLHDKIDAISIVARPSACVSDHPVTILSLNRPSGPAKFTDPITSCFDTAAQPADATELAAVLNELRTYRAAP